jgi:hypothetical protein
MAGPLGNRMVLDEDRIRFHPEQLKWLEGMFPEIIASPTSTAAEMYFNAGMRRVIAVVRNKVQQ